MAIPMAIKNRIDERVEMTISPKSNDGVKEINWTAVRMETTVSGRLKSTSWEFGENVQGRNEMFERERKLTAS